MTSSCHLVLTALALLLAAPVSDALAQEASPSAAVPPSFDEVQATIARMQARLDRLGSATSERDNALRFLEQQIEQATGQITGTDKTNESLRGETAALSNQVEDISRDRDRLTGEIGQRQTALQQLEAQVATLSEELGQSRDARSLLEQELQSARTTLAGATASRDELEAKLATLQATAESAVKTVAQRLAGSEADAAEHTAELDRLRAQTSAQQREIGQLNGLLANAESTVDAQQETIAGLDEKLAAALRAKVEELEQYRSEFFGRLHQALGDRPDLRVVGDRFVFQSELLFASGSAKLDPEGESELRQLARTLTDVAARIPPGVDWILRVDGHTDRQPIRDASFRSNWELSAARAISVIQFLTQQGIPPEHLAAAGFGEYRPIDPGNDEIAYRRNRRIEFKLTEG